MPTQSDYNSYRLKVVPVCKLKHKGPISQTWIKPSFRIKHFQLRSSLHFSLTLGLDLIHVCETGLNY